jgi:hypothetical protein
LTDSLERPYSLISHLNQSYIGLTVTRNLDFFTPGNLTSVYTRWMSLPTSTGQDFHSKPVRSVIAGFTVERLVFILTSHLNQPYIGLTVTRNLDYFTPCNLTFFYTRWMSLPTSAGQDFHSKPVQSVLDRFTEETVFIN